jgi:DNA-binding winged helix-turn-helix (wHTH) protein
MPRDAHIRQLIRRVRRSFIKAGLPDLIESRYGQGYRIRLLKARR